MCAFLFDVVYVILEAKGCVIGDSKDFGGMFVLDSLV